MVQNKGIIVAIIAAAVIMPVTYIVVNYMLEKQRVDTTNEQNTANTETQEQLDHRIKQYRAYDRCMAEEEIIDKSFCARILDKDAPIPPQFIYP